MDGSGLDRTDDFQKFCGSGLNWIQFDRTRTGLGPKNFTVRSSLLATRRYALLVKSQQQHKKIHDPGGWKQGCQFDFFVAKFVIFGLFSTPFLAT